MKPGSKGPEMRMVLLCFHQLPACSLGCYGEFKIPTPEFDAFASQSILFENVIVSPTGPDLPQTLSGSLPEFEFICRDVQAPPSAMSFPFEIPQTDAPAILQIRIAAGLPEALYYAAVAESWLGEQTPEFCSALGVAGSHLESSQALADALAMLNDRQRPLLTHAAHVARCDRLLGEWLEFLENQLQDGDVVVLTSLQGDSRRHDDGRPQWLQSVSEPVVHLPLIVHQAGKGNRLRLTGLFDSGQAARAIALLHDSGNDINLLQRESAETVRYESSLARAIRTPRWLLVERLNAETSDDEHLQLFHKPEDFWEVHNVSREFPELIEQYLSTGEL